MIRVFELDEKDKMILELLEKNPEISQNDIAKVVGLSQPSVGARIKRMKEQGLISHVYGINLKKSGLHILKVDIKCKKPREILSKFSRCPYFLNGFIVAGNKNLTLMFAGEDLSTLEAIIDNHIRSDPEVFDLEMGIILKSENDIVMPIKIRINEDKPPCNSDCGSCEYYLNELCLGCPITRYYKGNLWK